MKKRRSLLSLTIAVVLGMTCIMTGCGNNKGGADDSAYPDAVSLLNAAWASMNVEFPAMGGGGESTVDGAPGALPLSEKDMISYSLLVPEELQSDLTDAACVMHMMNANIFTGVVIKLGNTDSAEAAAQIENKIKNNQFMCGFPDKLVVITFGHYVAYAYGETANVDVFSNALKALDGPELVIDERLQ